MADINSRFEIGVTTGPIRGSRKIHVGPLNVAMREITLLSLHVCLIKRDKNFIVRCLYVYFFYHVYCYHANFNRHFSKFYPWQCTACRWRNDD